MNRACGPARTLIAAVRVARVATIRIELFQMVDT